MKEFYERVEANNLVIRSISAGELQLKFAKVPTKNGIVDKVDRILPNQPVDLSKKYPKSSILGCEKLKEKILKKEIIIVPVK